MMSMGDAIAICFRKYATFSGRARRPEYWWFFLFNFLMNIVLTIIDGALFGFGEDSLQPLRALYALGVLIPGLAVTWRRLHDVDKPGYTVFLPIAVMLPLGLVSAALSGVSMDAMRFGLIATVLAGVATEIYVVVLLASRSEPGENRFGPEPGAPLNVAGVFE